MVQRVSALAGSNTADIEVMGSSNSVGLVGGRLAVMRGYHELAGQQQTLLGKRLASPDFPGYTPMSWWWVLLGCAVAIVFICNALRDGDKTSSAIWGAIIPGIFIILVPLALKILIDFKRHMTMKARIPRWQQAMSTWHKLYYCNRDDMVFLPGTSHAVSSYQMDQLL